MSSSGSGVLELIQKWAEAELKGDTDTLAGLVTDDFRLVGPVGFVLTREPWLDRYRKGGLENSAFEIQDPEVREYGDTALVLGVQAQQTTVGGRDASGSFRVLVAVVRQGDRLAIAHIHISGAPPAAAAGAPPGVPQNPPRSS
jgi:ketosteroid isomerase-like protein